MKTLSCDFSLKDRLRSIHFSTRLLFVVSLIVYSPFIFQQLNNADCNNNGYLYHYPGYGWENAQGRFLIRFFDMWRNGIVSPVLIVVLSLIFLCAASELLINIFDIKSETSAFLTGALLIFSPSFADLFSYYYTLDSYCFAFFLCALSAHLLINKQGVLSKVVSGILLFISMGIYQAYSGFTLCLIIMWLIKKCFDKDDSIKEPLFTTLWAFVTYGISTLVYLAVFKILAMIKYLAPVGERGANNILGNFISSFFTKLIDSYADLFRYFFTDNIVNNSWYERRWLNAASMILTAVLIVLLVIKKKTYKNAGKILTLTAGILLIPVMVFLITILAPTSSIYAETGILLLSYINIIYVIPLILPQDNKKLSIAAQVVLGLICVVLVVFIQVFAEYIDREQVQISNLANRLVYRMESLDEYAQDQQVLVVGRPQKGNYDLPDEKYEAITKGMISHYSQIFGAEDQISDGWIKAFKYFVGVRYTECSAGKRKELIASDEVQSMGIYPAGDSVKRIDDVVVIKLSDWEVQN
ncbi:MAG: glucosyltransferase domain-containing protein [Lachnospiraceae bacterium]|nr:glucosyltransferase domain-containing protein [Lachnospiraceae bacterium]